VCSGQTPAAVVEAPEGGRLEIEALVAELHGARGGQRVLLRRVLELDIRPGDDDVQRLVGSRALYEDVGFQRNAAEVVGLDANPGAGAFVRKGDAHVAVIDDHVAGNGLRDGDGRWRHDDGLLDVAPVTAVEDIGSAELEDVYVGDGGGKQQVVARNGPVVPLLLAR
jgi:hypothetical protein